MTKAQNTKQLVMPTLGCVSAKVAQVRRIMQSESSYLVLYGHSLRDSFGASSREVVGRGAIAESLQHVPFPMSYPVRTETHKSMETPSENTTHRTRE